MSDFPLKSVFLSGINGAGMSGLARILLEAGVAVSGSDRERVEVSDELLALGATIRFEQCAENLSKESELFIHSAAIRAGHPEYDRAGELGIRRLKYAEMLGELSRLRRTIAIAGTHGKTSTTNMCATMFRAAGAEPSWIVGGTPLGLPAASHWGEGQHFIVEACEYDRSFHQLSPEVALLHNIEADHMDYYGTLANLKRSFREFAELTHGCVVANFDDPLVREAVDGIRVPVLSYGRASDADVQARRVRLSEGFVSFDLSADGSSTHIQPGIPGRTALPNALAAAAIGIASGLRPDAIAAGLSQARSVKRRFELLAEQGSVAIYDDYAHHPTSVRELAASARSRFAGRHLTFIFQAHQYARLIGFFDEFAQALTGIDRVIIAPTYAARESNVTPGVPERELVETLRSRGTNAEFAPSLDAAAALVAMVGMRDQVIFSVGAGDVTKVGHELAARLRGLSDRREAA
ncbi:MAG: UDP-N-acetylmuramate--L-alanine ligase [Planctomycetes bacterium]|nr:UDP-N-acetylmuramate--L-alanine ligase [Planctomycetota bacterium]